MLKNFRAYIPIFFSMLFWGMSFIWTKDLLNAGFSPIIIITLRVLISAVLLYVIFKIAGKLDKIDKKDYKLFMALAFFEPFLYFFGENWGLQYLDPSIGSIIISTIPVFVPFGLYFFHKEALHWQLIIGVFLTIIGLFIISLSPNAEFSVSGKGIALMFLAVFSAAGYSVVLYNVIKKYEPITITTTQNIIGSIYYLPLFLIFELKTLKNLTFNFDTLYPLFALAILCSSIAFICYSYSAKRLSIPKTSVFTNAVPIVTILFAVLLGKEYLTVNKVVGMVVVLLGVFLSQINFKRMNYESKSWFSAIKLHKK
jgi:drug/metabolite transporter (DMT)-like permease